jgi:hypothetical protein
VNCTTSDSRGNTATGSFNVTVTLLDNRIGRFVVFSRDHTELRAGTTVVTGDVGANERRFHAHAGVDEDGDRDDVTMRVGNKDRMQHASSRVVGDVVSVGTNAIIYNVVDNTLLNRHGSIAGAVTSPMAMPYLELPAFAPSLPGTGDVTVSRNATLTLPAGAYASVHVSQGGTLVLSGGIYHMLSLDVDQLATVLFRGATELRIKTELDTGAKAKLILDQSVAGLKASQMIVYVEGDDFACQHSGTADDDGDDSGHVSVHIGQKNVVHANVYARNGTIWLKSNTQATGSFIGLHVRIGASVALTLDSAFK